LSSPNEEIEYHQRGSSLVIVDAFVDVIIIINGNDDNGSDDY